MAERVANESSKAAAVDASAKPGDATDHDDMAATQMAPAPNDAPAAGPAEKSSGNATRAADGRSPSTTARKISQLGDFKLLKKLGQGGMGTVYLATQISLDRKVAIKTLSKELSQRADLVQRFLREARAMARLAHANIVQVYAADSAHGLHYAAIEYIDGRSMQDWMDRLKTLSVGDALHVALVTAEALSHAHDENMIHRDIKPDNILVTRKGVVKVSDFGLVKAVDEDVSMTQSGTGMGTPLYMAPEQARNAKHVDRRTDIYALGTMLYYFLTGQHPYTAASTLELILAKEQGRFTPARRLNPEVPERLDLMIDKMIARDPQHRYASCEELIADLESLNLASGSLSFIDVPDKAAVRRSSPSRAGLSGSSPTLPAMPRSSAEDAELAKPQESVVVREQIWFVKFTNAQGRLTVSKMTTDQVRRGLKAGTLDLKTTASKSAKGEFLPLAQYREFEQQVHGRAVMAKAEKRSRGLADMYEQIDKEVRRHKRWRFFRRLTEGALGWFGLVIWLAVIAGLGYLAYLFVPRLYEFVAEKLNVG
ncbi:MAG: serine/threonine protein kinase [Planctomycetes bacterium]|nr:serine/threonine protein kinase [Planctomycetota bacterium]